MKYLSGIFAFSLWGHSIAPIFGAAWLGWTPPSNEQTAGYKIYYGTVSRVYNHSLAVPAVNSFKINHLVIGQVYYFAVTSTDTNGGESSFSNEASCLIKGNSLTPMAAPQIFFN